MTYICNTTVREYKVTCFAGSSQVTLANGTFKTLSDANIGDQVLVNKHNLYEPILGFIHAKHEDLDFLAIEVQSLASNSSTTILVSSNHLIFDFDSDYARFPGKYRIGNRVQLIENNQSVPVQILRIQLTK
ncbi:unnamed protein product [Rotaria sp. Silwood2]|nr:unnamed protein product [Rotaria sp. Silwood2]CAF3048245.1 unnamed protein product [Rotaria sp. Silwood2]CAF3305415.1 unnamed protein product [Rotaria sp. Silwood2]CAF3392472.1 unnamed protein product [Rotaria sp. Silwood2]CAF4254589.1 unnamed protein product [Rotaria sp. Silwood2]